MRSNAWIEPVRLPLAVALTVLVAASACERDKDRTADPAGTASALLSLHDLAGRQPEERPKEILDREVDRAALRALVADLDEHDKFISDIYLGFVVGALARNQRGLFVTTRGDDAAIEAGKATIRLKLVGSSWKIILDASVPDEIKERAAAQKKSYEEARARASGT
jgi:hypothetical protein